MERTGLSFSVQAKVIMPWVMKAVEFAEPGLVFKIETTRFIDESMWDISKIKKSD